MKPIILTILDGWGINAPSLTNAISMAKIPNLKKIEENYPYCSLQSSAIAAGLPWKEAGNSEVGHLIIGSGRIVYQYLPRILMEIKDGKFFKNQKLLNTIKHVKKNNSVLHLVGLISSGNVHSYLEHVYGLLELAKQNDIANLRLHLFTDGKDAPIKEGAKVISTLMEKFKNPNWKIASVIGRYYGMDRNNNWDRTEAAYNLIAQGIGEKTQDLIKTLREYYDQDIIDTYIKPIVIVDENQKPIGTISDNDAIIFWDFREDSAKQLTGAFAKENFNKFKRTRINNLFLCTMIEYDKYFNAEVAYPPTKIKNHLLEVLNANNKKVLKIAETEKYAHVTYFFNCGKEEPYPNETRKLIPSKIVSHYEENPEMQAEEITKTILEGLKGNYDLIVANYANADMMGHTGNLDAAIKAAEYVDSALKPVMDLAEKGNCILIITADHGNIEQMVNLRTGEVKTEHTLNPVPFYLIGTEFKVNEKSPKFSFETPCGMLQDIAPTILALMHVPQPPEMTGANLLEILISSYQ
ncbi:MAG TPA: 2,3-bisphosphoglycerate-independent phosphoglycerate mutase [Candidatus Paceibacterota bacterium]|nr:2,3-bisphosphoglycerate-independent phosphoglycerate mutase [Candidatus Paceibacterota bacterium]